MMNTILVWVLVTINSGSHSSVVYSPYLPDLETCQFLQQNVPYRAALYTKCIQIKVVK